MTKEIDALSRAADTEDGGHRNVVRYYGKDEDQFFVYIYMELCDFARLASGVLVPCDLSVRVAQLATPEERQRAAEQLFDGIEYLHAHQIVHRDSSPRTFCSRVVCSRSATWARAASWSAARRSRRRSRAAARWAGCRRRSWRRGRGRPPSRGGRATSTRPPASCSTSSPAACTPSVRPAPSRSPRNIPVRLSERSI